MNRLTEFDSSRVALTLIKEDVKEANDQKTHDTTSQFLVKLDTKGAAGMAGKHTNLKTDNNQNEKTRKKQEETKQRVKGTAALYTHLSRGVMRHR